MPNNQEKKKSSILCNHNIDEEGSSLSPLIKRPRQFMNDEEKIKKFLII